MPETALEGLVRRHLADEDEGTLRLFRELRPARRRGYLTRSELEAVCRWKSPRAIWHVRANTHHAIRRATSIVFTTRSETRRMDALLTLKGVSVPMASSALMLLFPRRYGVIDIRVWQLLHRAGAVRGNAAGVGLTAAHWHEFLAIVRGLGRTLRLTPRQVELALFEAHRAAQEGRLYKSAAACSADFLRSRRAGRE
jgi:hypothetical protein